MKRKINRVFGCICIYTAERLVRIQKIRGSIFLISIGTQVKSSEVAHTIRLGIVLLKKCVILAIVKLKNIRKNKQDSKKIILIQ